VRNESGNVSVEPTLFMFSKGRIKGILLIKLMFVNEIQLIKLIFMEEI